MSKELEVWSHPSGLMKDQYDAAMGIEEWLNNTNEMTCGVWGSAGYGKSWCAKYIINKVILANSNYEPVICSLTHSAVAVLSDFVGRDVRTLHSLMGWVPYVDKETGEEGISTPKMRDKNAEPRLNSSMVIIVDEAGLTGHDELALLLAECRETGARVIFMGDHKQCFPVIKEGQKLCIPAHELDNTKFTLTIPKRQAEGDAIFALAQAYRATVDGAPQPKPVTFLNPQEFDENGKKLPRKGVRWVDDIEEIAYTAFKCGVRDGNTRNIKVLAFTNKRCLALNRKIRKNVMGLSDPCPVVGEEMVANTTIQDATGDECLIRNNRLLIVTGVEKTTSYGLDGAFLRFDLAQPEDDEPVEVPEILFVPSTPQKLLDRLKKLSNDAKAFKANGFDAEASQAWRTFFSLKEGCADIRFTYAMTVNKCQGVTLKHALIDMWNINSSMIDEDKARKAYTAVTRATHFVTIEGELDSPFKYDGDLKLGM